MAIVESWKEGYRKWQPSLTCLWDFSLGLACIDGWMDDMGIFEINIGVGNLSGGDLEPVTAIVDTRASHSMLPASLLTNLRVEVWENDRRFLADGTEARYDFDVARVANDDRQLPCPVIFGPEDRYLLGATTLEIFGVMVDSEGERLVRKENLARPI